MALAPSRFPTSDDSTFTAPGGGGTAPTVGNWTTGGSTGSSTPTSGPTGIQAGTVGGTAGRGGAVVGDVVGAGPGLEAVVVGSSLVGVVVTVPDVVDDGVAVADADVVGVDEVDVEVVADGLDVDVEVDVGVGVGVAAGLDVEAPVATGATFDGVEASTASVARAPQPRIRALLRRSDGRSRGRTRARWLPPMPHVFPVGPR